MDPLSGPFPPSSSGQLRLMSGLTKSRSLDQIQTASSLNSKKKLSVKTSSHKFSSLKSSKSPVPSTRPSNPRRSLRPTILPEPILFPSSSSSSPPDDSFHSFSQSLDAPGDATEILRSASASETSSFPSSLPSSNDQSQHFLQHSKSRGLGIGSSSMSEGGTSHWSDGEDEEEEELLNGAANSTEPSHLVEDDLPGAKARKVLGLNTEGWEVGPGAEEPTSRRSPSIKSVNSDKPRQSLLPAILSTPARRNSMSMELGSLSFGSLGRGKQTSQVAAAGLQAPITSPHSSIASPDSSSGNSFISKNQATKIRGRDSGFSSIIATDDLLDWEEELQGAARAAEVNSMQPGRLGSPSFALWSPRGASPSSSSMARSCSAGASFEQEVESKKQRSFNSVSDFITSYSKSGSVHQPGSKSKVYITPLNLPSPQAVRNANVRGRTPPASRRPRFDPNPLPAYALNRSESGSVGLMRSGCHFSTSGTPAPPRRPPRSHLRSTSDSRTAASASQLSTRKVPGTSHGTRQTEDLAQSELNRSPSRLPSPGAAGTTLRPSPSLLSVNSNLSHNPGLSSSGSASASDGSPLIEPRTTELSSPASVVNMAGHRVESGLFMGRSKMHPADLEEQEPSHEKPSNSTSSFPLPSKSAPPPPSSAGASESQDATRVDDETSSGSLQRVGSLSISGKARKKLSGLFSISSHKGSKIESKGASPSSSIQIPNNLQRESFGEAGNEHSTFSSSHREGGRSSQLPEPDRFSLSLDLGFKDSDEVDGQTDQFSQSLSSSFGNFNASQLSRTSTSTTHLNSVFSKDRNSIQQGSVSSGVLRDSMFSQSWTSSAPRRIPSSLISDEALPSRFSRATNYNPDVPRTVSLASQSPFDFDFDLEPEFLRGLKLVHIPGTGGVPSLPASRKEDSRSSQWSIPSEIGSPPASGFRMSEENGDERAFTDGWFK